MKVLQNGMRNWMTGKLSNPTTSNSKRKRVQTDLYRQLAWKDQLVSTLELQRDLVTWIQDTSLKTSLISISTCLKEPLKTLPKCLPKEFRTPSTWFSMLLKKILQKLRLEWLWILKILWLGFRKRKQLTDHEALNDQEQLRKRNH